MNLTITIVQGIKNDEKYQCLHFYSQPYMCLSYGYQMRVASGLLTN